MSSTSDIELLPCGRDPVTVWDRAVTQEAASATDEVADDSERRHERGCPYCQAVIAQYLLLARAGTTYLRQAITPPADLVNSVMRVVLTELRPGTAIPLPVPPELGSATITDTALAGVLRALLDSDPTVLVHSCRVSPSGPDRGAGLQLIVQLSLAISYAHYQLSGDAAVRQRVITSAREMCGLVVTAVDIDVVDVFVGDDTTTVIEAEPPETPPIQRESRQAAWHAISSGGEPCADQSTAVAVHYTDHALARIAAYTARVTPGVARLHPRLGRWALTAARRALAEPVSDSAAVSAVQIHRSDGLTVVEIRLAVGLDPDPLDTVTDVLAAERAALVPLLPGPIAIRATVLDVEP